jgi:hypothetical protein
MSQTVFVFGIEDLSTVGSLLAIGVRRFVRGAVASSIFGFDLHLDLTWGQPSGRLSEQDFLILCTPEIVSCDLRSASPTKPSNNSVGPREYR